MKSRNLFFISFLILFLELILIRYLAGNIWNLGYFPNFVLLAVFIGMGIGFVFHIYVPESRTQTLFQTGLFLLFLILIFVYWLQPGVPGFGTFSGEFGEELFFTATHGVNVEASYLLFFVWFVGVAGIFALISQSAAKLFALFKPLTAYSINIGGSCAGILSFMMISWIGLPAYTWFLLTIPVALASIPNIRFKQTCLIILILILSASISWFQDQKLSGRRGVEDFDTRWSPYQKIEVAEQGNSHYIVYANGVHHQVLHPVQRLKTTFYQIPYDHRSDKSAQPPYRKVLIIGAGCGNDVAAALLNGVQYVDAVEIDPMIANIGENLHEARPYQDSRVNLIIDDARAFLHRTDKTYDLIVFALTDSLVKVSPVAQLRLENYLFTVEAVREAYERLSDEGDLLFYNFYRKPWLIKKLNSLIVAATGKLPETIWHKRDFWVFKVGKYSRDASKPLEWDDDVQPATDDWPFVYLRKRSMPKLYQAGVAVMTGVVVFLLFLLHLTSRNDYHETRDRARFLARIAFILMGVAFLLLETKGVIQFSLLFGTTWVNTSLVFLAVLVLVLLANWIAPLFSTRRMLPIACIFLIGSCIFPILYPLGNLLQFDTLIVRYIVASLMIFSPIFFANLMFSLIFKNQKVAERLFGWNLIGATLGGIVEYFSMLSGYTVLAYIVVFIYLTVTGIFFQIEWMRRRAFRMV